MSHVDPSLCYFGAEAILNRLETMLPLTQKVRDNDDVDAVHDMRVASRRTRTALQLFAVCFPARKVKSWNKRLKRVTRRLGDARDTDVQIEFVQDFLKGVSDRKCRPGIRRLLLRLRQRRQDLQEEVVTALDRFETHQDVADMRACLLQQIAHGRLHQAEPGGQATYQHAQREISCRLDEMLAQERYVQQPESIQQLHEMRIAAKHLRYAMEIFRPLYGDALDEAIDAAKEAQRRLGEIHDCDVWVAFLPVFLEQERQRTLEYFGREGPVRPLLAGIEHLRRDRQSRRDTEYASFVTFWQQLQERRVWGRLLMVLERKAGALRQAEVQPQTGCPESGV